MDTINLFMIRRSFTSVRCLLPSWQFDLSRITLIAAIIAALGSSGRLHGEAAGYFFARNALASCNSGRLPSARSEAETSLT
jgi:hypothetical protein